jgi:hypothetical protein
MVLDCISGGHSHAEDESGHSHNECNHDVHEFNSNTDIVPNATEVQSPEKVKTHKKFLEIFKGKNYDT